MTYLGGRFRFEFLLKACKLYILPLICSHPTMAVGSFISPAPDPSPTAMVAADSKSTTMSIYLYKRTHSRQQAGFI
jgi:hypothetical protein